jgi:uncharacterized protein (TIGR00297 family)
VAPILAQALLGFAAASGVSLAALRTGALTRGGALAATIVGTLAASAGIGWIVLLLTLFITSTLLSRWRRPARDLLLEGIVEKGGARDAMQVLANGAVFAVSAVAFLVWPSATWMATAAGAIAAATADTWSTEIGTVAGGAPRHILNGSVLSPGMSGGITVAGSAAAVLAAFVIAGVVGLVAWPLSTLSIVAGGVGGALVDSVLGATIQERRWCEHCGQSTERRVHGCGATTVVRGGLGGFTNDVVNLTSVLVGATITRVLS